MIATAVIDLAAPRSATLGFSAPSMIVWRLSELHACELNLLLTTALLNTGQDTRTPHQSPFRLQWYRAILTDLIYGG